jgi:hypothetical protein
MHTGLNQKMPGESLPPGVSAISCTPLSLPINLSQHNVQAAHNGHGISHERTLADGT